jgi:hypothetical protein
MVGQWWHPKLYNMEICCLFKVVYLMCSSVELVKIIDSPERIGSLPGELARCRENWLSPVMSLLTG